MNALVACGGLLVIRDRFAPDEFAEALCRREKPHREDPEEGA